MRTRRQSKQPQSTGEEGAKKTRLLSDISDDKKTLLDKSGDAVTKLLRRVKKGSNKEDDVYLRLCESAAEQGMRLKENNKELLDKTVGKDTADTDSCRGDAFEHASSEVKVQTGTSQDYNLDEEYEDSDWEDGSIPTLSSPKEYQKDLVSGVSVEFDVSPGSAKRKSVRRATSEEKEMAEVVHKCHLLCLLGRGRLIDGACNDPLIQTMGTQFVLNGKPLYFNGFNSYWLMYMAADPSTRVKVPDTFQQASKYGMNVARTWAFSDGGYRPLQSSPGSYNEDMFKGLDFVISEANKYGIHLILSLVNNWEGFGGKKQYVQWARDRGQYMNNDDDFFSNNIVKGYYKNHIKAVLTRVNSITGIAYKDDPTIFAWELMNEPRCQTDLSGKTIQDWVVEMSNQVKSIDKNHLLEVGMEGFYGESMPEKKQFNPGYEVGTDFISNNLVPGIDFATIHLYPDQWVPGADDEAQTEFVEKWIGSHSLDSKTVLGKPLMVTEFGKSSRSSGFSVMARDSYFGTIFNSVYSCARSGGPCGGALFWQVMAEGMENWSDGYEVVLDQSPSTAAVINQQSARIASIS